jgi:hypothetical protein
MERDKLLRLLGMGRAGFEQAEGWMKSADVSLRRKAVAVFADINDVEAGQRLEVLSRDPDTSVAGEARRAYAARQN